MLKIKIFDRGPKVLERKRYFKYAHFNYWTKRLSDGSVECWAYACESSEAFFLGKYENEKITECDGFYGHVLPWSVQKGAERLFKLVQESCVSK